MQGLQAHTWELKKKYGMKVRSKIIDFYYKNKVGKSMKIKTNNKNINYIF